MLIPGSPGQGGWGREEGRQRKLVFSQGMQNVSPKSATEGELTGTSVTSPRLKADRPIVRSAGKKPAGAPELRSGAAGGRMHKPGKPFAVKRRRNSSLASQSLDTTPSTPPSLSAGLRAERSSG